VQREVRLQRELRSAEKDSERLANLLTLSYEPMFAWHLDGLIEFWNTGAERLYGFSSNEAVGHSSHILLQTKFPIEFAELRSRLLNERYWSGELRHICKDGQEVAVDSRMQMLADDTVLEVNRDVTQARTLNIQRGSCASRKRTTIALAGIDRRV
jgi:PAS domain S-box-containing protein